MSASAPTPNSIMQDIAKSLEYNALDHKWIARNYLKEHPTYLRDDPNFHAYLSNISNSSFDYYEKYNKTLNSDTSIRAITGFCTDDELASDVQIRDSKVVHLANVFNNIISSTRKVHKCYDCGTNARAMFLKLIETHRGVNYISAEEQRQMKREYRVTHTQVAEELEKCYRRMLTVESDTIFIMSLSIQSFGHVWVIEKRFIGKSRRPRYHHYQSSLRSHLVLDFIEREDYGRNLQQSLNIHRFFADLKRILSLKTAWNDSDYRLFTKLFAFHPVSRVTKPDPGFCFTSITY